MIETQLHKDVVVITIANPPVNALGEGVRRGLLDALEAALGDTEIVGIVITGSGMIFSGGADITEFGKPFGNPALPEVIDAIESSGKPVVAALNGMALGGGLELAMGCHYRVAAPSVRLGLPEVTLGLIPGAGGTQRLPRLVGAEAALDIIVSGKPITADKAKRLGLIDELAESGSLIGEAVSMARTASGVRRARDRCVEIEPGFIENFTAQYAHNMGALEAPRACVKAVSAAGQLPFEDGLRTERELFQTLVESDQSRALRHAFFAERTSAKIEGLPKETQPRVIHRIGIVGAGTMGGGIAMNFLSAGLPVTIVDMSQDAIDRGVGIIRRNYEASAAKGRISAEQVANSMALLTSATDIAALDDCDLVIEAVYEDMDVKKEIFRRLDTMVRQGVILASNTSYLDIDEIANVTSRPGDVVGMHFFSPANVMKLLEVVRGAKTLPDVLSTAVTIGRKVGKVAVVSGVCYGFIGNRMLSPRLNGAIEMLLAGATPAQVDRVSLELGMPMGPLQMVDLAGVDIGWHRDPGRVESVRDALNAAGRWGQKTGAGFYDYDEKRRPVPSPTAQKIIEQFRAKAGTAVREVSDEEVAVRTLHVMVNEGAKILEEGIAQRASDIDTVWLFGYGWPRHTGGPMYWAEKTIGLGPLVDTLRRYQDRLGPDFSLSPLLTRYAAEGKSFYD